MRWLLLLAVLVACGGGSGEIVPSGGGVGYATWSGEVDRRACATPSTPGAAPLRCIAPAGAPPLALAVCGDLSADNTLAVGRDLRASGAMRVASPVQIGGSAFIGGPLTANNTVDVGGKLHAASQDGSATVRADTGAAFGPLDASETLDCAGAPDVAALARSSALHHYDAPADALAAVKEPTTVTLGCDRYRFSSVGVDNVLDLRVEGQTVIVVDGDVRIAAPTNIVLAPGATLDFAISGSLSVDNTLSISGGDTWLGVGGKLRVLSPMVLEGYLLVPRGDVEATNTLTVRGAAFVGPLAVRSPLKVEDAGYALSPSGCYVR